MTLQELSDDLLPSFPLSIQKDVQTAVRYLAQALHCTDPQHCTPEHYNLPLPTLYRLIETSLSDQGKSGHTIRNTKNLLSRLFRLAAEQDRFSLVPTPLTKHYTSADKPIRPGLIFKQRHGKDLPYPQWPIELQEAFTAYQTWATAPLIPGRPARFRKRVSTLEIYRRRMEGYFGYLYHVEHLTPTFEHLFDLSHITAYVHWHVNICHQRSTLTIREFLSQLLALTNQYRLLPELRAQLATLRKTIPAPTPIFNKADAWVPLATLAEIGLALWPKKQPKDLPHPNIPHAGSRYAARAGLSLMFQLWTFIPYRQRNIREMRLGTNLRKDTHGIWRLTFRGEQLKIATKRGQTNVFDLPFPDKLVPLLEDYLSTWRPILLAKASHPYDHVFLTWRGAPYQSENMTKTTQHNVYRYTGKHWHPHIIRTVWATEWIRNTHGDFYTAAIMLNDRLETVIANYAHLLEENVAEKAYRLIEERNRQGK